MRPAEGEIEILARETLIAAVTVIEHVALSPASVAVTLAAPALTAVTRPALLTEAIEAAEELNEEELVSVAVLPSEYVPVTVSCCVTPAESEIVEGDTEMLLRVAPLVVAAPVVTIRPPGVSGACPSIEQPALACAL